MNKLYVIGLGPGGRDYLTLRAIEAIKESDLIVSYTKYLKYAKDLVEGKEVFTSGMKEEIKRCEYAIEGALKGKTVSILSTGDSGLYGMAGPIFELSRKNIDIEVIPGVSAIFAAASRLGAPLMHDVAIISLSDLLTPLDLIMERVDLASKADFVLGFYNPRSKTREDYLEKAFDIIKKYKDPKTPCAYVKNALREGEKIKIASLDDFPFDEVDMNTIVIVGNKSSYTNLDKFITKRGYEIWFG